MRDRQDVSRNILWAVGMGVRFTYLLREPDHVICAASNRYGFMLVYLIEKGVACYFCEGVRG